MIIGAHTILHSTNPQADREFLRDVLEFPSVDVGDGWLIFGLPPSEIAVHDAEDNGRHTLYLMCDDVEAFVAQLADRDIVCDPVEDEGWGLVTQFALPGGGQLHVYQPSHPRPEPIRLVVTPTLAPEAPSTPPPRKKTAKKPAAKKAAPKPVAKKAAPKPVAKKVAKAPAKPAKKKAAKKQR
jgi:hypothetical protein